MSNIKIIHDCTAKTTSYVPLSGAEIKERKEAAKKYAEELAAKEAAALEAPVAEKVQIEE